MKNYYFFMKMLILTVISFGSLNVFAQDPLLVGSISANQSICTGTSPVQLVGTVPLNGTDPTYQWQSSPDNILFGDISGATLITYQPGVLTATTYYRQLQNAVGTTGGPLPTNTVTITVKPFLIAGSISPNQSICSGANPAPLVAVPPSTGTTPTYQWQLSLTGGGYINISGATDQTYQPNPLFTTTDSITWYFRQRQNDPGTCGGPLNTNVITLTVKPNLIVGSVSGAQTICPGVAPSVLSGTAPENGLEPTYQWQSSLDNNTFANINGATLMTYQPGTITATTWFRMIQNAGSTCGGPLPTNAVAVTFEPDLMVGSISANQTLCVGEVPAQLTGVPPSNGTSPVYQWQSSLDNVTFANINGATMLNYQPSAITTMTYFRQLQDATGTCGGPLPTNVVTISINPDLIVGSVSANQSICSGATAAVLTSVAPSTGTAPTYQWQSSLNNVTFANINGATLTTYQPGALSATTYFRQLQNTTGTCGGPLPTDAVSITVNPELPVSVSVVASATQVCSGTSVTFTATPVNGGNNPQYQWSVNGASQGINNPVFSYNPVNGDVVHVTLTSDALCATGNPAVSNSIAMTVTPNLAVGSISADQTLCAGTVPALLSGVAPSNGTTPVYQWQSSLDNATFANINGATMLNYQPSAITTMTYFRQLQDATGTCGGPLPTNVVTISINPDLIVGSVSASQSICSGATAAVLTSVAPSTGTVPAYQWQNSPNNVNFFNITGATLATYQPGVLTVTTYFRQLQNATGTCGGPLPTNAVSITVNPELPVSVSVVASASQVCTGTSVTFTATAVNGGSNPLYQWSVNGANAGTNNPVFSYAPVNGDVVICTLTSDALCATGNPAASNTITMMVTPNLVVGSISADQIICSGSLPAMLTGVAPSNGTAPAYQWQSSLDNVTFANINGATMLNYQPSAITTMTYFRQLQDATGTCGGPLPTNVVTISLKPDLIVGSVSADQSVCSGATAAVLTSVAPSTGTSPTYQWQSSLNNVTFANINGATMMTYQPGVLSATTYFRQLQNAAEVCGGPLPTNAVTITVNPVVAVSVSVVASATQVCIGTSVTFTATAVNGGNNPLYQWSVNGTNQGTNNPVFSYAPVNGDVVICTLTSDALCATGNPAVSNTITMTVTPNLLVGSISADQTICSGTLPAMLTGIAPSNGTAPAYQWQSSLDNVTFANINGATMLNYQPSALSAMTYFRQLQDASGTCGGPLPTNVVTISVNPDLIVGSVSASQSICSGATAAVLTSVAPSNGTVPAYQWQSSLNNVTFSNINGATMTSYQPGMLSATTYFRQLQNATGVCGGPLPTNSVSITVNPVVVVSVSVVASATQVCSGTSVTFTATPVNGGSNPLYQWSVNGANQGTNNPVFSYIPVNGDVVICTLTSDALCATGNPAVSNTITITVNPNLIVGSISADQTICAGTLPAMITSVAPSNGTAPTYQWQNSPDNVNFFNIIGATLATYQPGVLSATTYFRQLQNATGVCGGPLPTNAVSITVNPVVAVSVSVVASATQVCSGTTVTFTATSVNGGNNPLYQWSVNGTNQGTNNPVFSYIPVNGDVVICTLTSDALCATGNPAVSNTITMTVTPTLLVGSISADQTICAGTLPAMITGVAPSNGTAPTYQWQSSLNNITFANINGATMLNYQPGVLTTTTYFQQLQNAVGTCGGPLPTNVVAITVNPVLPVSVTVLASANPVCGGTSVTFTATPVNGGSDPLYQWSVNGTNQGTSNPVFSYIPANGDVVVCTLTSNASCATGNPATSSPVTITVLPNLIAGSISADQAICSGTIPAMLTGVAPSNGTAPTYQWQSSLDNVTFANINGATALNYQPGAISAVTYFRQLQNAAGTCDGPVMTNVVAITLNPDLIVGSVSADQSICSGATAAALTSVAPANGTTPTYQWQSSLNNVTFANINGATMTTYQPGVLSTTTYFRQLQNATGVCGGPLPTNSVSITVNPVVAVSVSVVASATQVCSGTTVTFTATAVNGGTNPMYQWSVNGTNQGTNNPVFSYIPVNGDVVICTLTSNALCATGNPATSSPVTITELPNLIAGSIGADQTICSGAIPAMLTGVAPSTGTSPTYQWQSSLDNATFANINGATALNYQPGTISAVTYFRQLQDASGVCGGPVLTNVVTISLSPDLIPGTISADQSICVGATPAQLNSTAPVNGTLPTYQWQSSLDNVTFANINGATMMSYEPSGFFTTTYFRQLQNAAGTCGGPLPTNVVTITVKQQFVAGSIGSNQSICAGDIPAAFTGVAPPLGTSPVYQWESSTDNSNFTAIAGATTLGYQAGAITSTTWFRLMQNTSGTCGGPVPTNVIKVTVDPNIIPGTISADQLVCSNAIPAMLVATPPANGTSPTYQWQSSLDNVTFANINGATALNYQSGLLSSTTYFRQLQNAQGVCGGPLPTNVVTITVSEALVVGSISADQTICAGTAPVLLSGVAPSNGTLPTYQWQSSLDNLTFANINGATLLNYQPGSLTSTSYYRQLQNATGVCGGPMPTNTVTITVTPSLLVGTISADQTICNGSVPALLTGVAPSNGTLPTYQWQSSLNNSTFSNINGATALNYQPGALTVTTYYRLEQNAAGVCGGPMPTNVVTITVGAFPALAVGSISASQSLCIGNIPAQLNGVAPSNGTVPVYQWQSSLNNTTFANINGATALNYQPGALTATTYYRQLQNAQGTCGGPLPTNVVTISVSPQLVVGSISASQTICTGTTPAQLNGIAPATGTAPTYQWQSSLNNTTFANINGATMLNYQPGSLAVTTYFRQIQNASGTCGGPLTTNVVTITVNPNFAVGSISANQAICSGSVPAQLNGTAPVAGTSPTYQWQNSPDNVTFANIPGATTLNYQPGALTATTYYRQIQNASGTCGGPLFTNVVTITVNPLPVPTITGPASACVNSVNVYTTQPGMSNYTWTAAGGTITAGSGTNAITVTWNTVGSQVVTVNYTTPANCTASAPSVYNVTVNPLPVPTIAGSASVCLNSTGNVYTTQTGMTGYSWTVTGGVITAGSGTNAITVTWNTVGAQTISLNYINGNGCTAATPTVYNVTVNPLPVPTVTGPASVCVNSTGNVYTTQTGMTGYTWTVTGGVITAGSGTNAITVTWNTVGAQTISLNYINGNGCTAATPTVYNVTVNPLPVPTITGPASVCVNTTGNVYTTQTGMTGYAWTVTGGTITAGSTTNSITVTWGTVGAQTITVNYINGNGCTAATPTVYNVTVNPLPVPTITGPASACVNSTGNVYTTEAGQTGYVWTITGGTLTGGTTNAVTVTWNTVGVQTLTVNYANASGCTAATPASKTVTVNPVPVPTITGPASACVGTTTNVYTTETGMTGYFWTVSSGGTITSGGSSNSITVTWTTAGAKTVCVTYTNASGCAAAAPTCYNVTVNAVPTPTVTGPASVCQGATATYTTQTGMTNYIWTVSNGGTIVGGGTSTSNTVTVQWNTVGGQAVSVNYTSTCPGAAPVIFNVTVNAAPVPTIGSTNDPCTGSTDNVYYTESGMTGYVWTVSPGGAIQSGAGTSTINVTWTGIGIQTVSVNYTNAGGCQAPQPTVYTVFVNSPPSAAGPVTGTASLCAGTNGVVYSTTPVSGATTYTWTLPNGATIVSGAGTTSITVNFAANAVSGTVTVSGTNQCGNGPSSSLAVTVKPIPATPVITVSGSVLTSSAPSGNQWYRLGIGLIAGATAQTYTATVPDFYWCAVTLSGCASDTSHHVQWPSVGQQELTGASFNVYPVPNNGNFRVSINTNVEETFTIRVYNQLGAMIYEMNDARTLGGKFSTQIRLDNVADGVYSVAFLNENHQVVRKMIVSRLINN